MKSNKIFLEETLSRQLLQLEPKMEGATKMKRITTDLNKNTNPTGTSLQGHLLALYSELVEIFGEPNSSGDDYKVDVEWIGEINGEVFTIYNYKNGKNYLGEDGIEVEEITDWNIGGKRQEVVQLVEDYIEQNIKGEVR